MRTDFTFCFPGRLLCRISPRFHLRMICRAIELEPYVWQRAFALGRISSLPGKRTRGNGKTTAVMLRLLMLPPDAVLEARKVHALDPGFVSDCDSAPFKWYAPALVSKPERIVLLQYAHEFRCLQLRCILSGVPVSDLDTNLFRHYLHY